MSHTYNRRRPVTDRIVEKRPEPCAHPHMKRCGLCDEMYCPNSGCDEYHVENCREAMRP